MYVVQFQKQFPSRSAPRSDLAFFARTMKSLALCEETPALVVKVCTDGIDAFPSGSATAAELFESAVAPPLDSLCDLGAKQWRS